MERKISDLVDAICEDEIDLGRSAPLSSKRIKDMTMEQFETEKPVSLRWLGRVAAVAAVIMALTITVFATEAVLGEGKLLGQFFGKELSDKQMEVAEDIGRGFTGSVCTNGTTVTPIEAVADEDDMYLHLRVEAPEGVVLRDLSEEDGYYYDFEPSCPPGNTKYDDDYWRMRIEYYWDNGHGEWHEMDVSHTVTTLADEDPTDNVKEFVIKFSCNDDYAIFNGPWEKYLHFQGLFIRKRMSTYNEEMLRGRFTLDVRINDEDRDDMKLVVDVDDVTVYNAEYDFTTTIKKIEITPLSITVDFESTQANNKYVFPKGGPIRLVMKDGTVVDAVDAYYNAAEHTYPHPDSVVGVGDRSCFDEIIVLSDIDYILIGGVHIVDVN